MSDQSFAHQQLLDRVRQQAAVTTTLPTVAVPQSQADGTDFSHEELADMTNQQKLATFEAVLDQIEQDQAADSTPPITDSTSVASPNTLDDPVEQLAASGNKHKEQLEGFGIYSPELPGGMQQVEAEPSPEISAELESFLQRTEKPEQLHVEQQLQEFAAQAAMDQATSAQKMKVLPITKEQEIIGLKKSPAFSLRWLVEFSQKITKIFTGKAIYRQGGN